LELFSAHHDEAELPYAEYAGKIDVEATSVNLYHRDFAAIGHCGITHGLESVVVVHPSRSMEP
jgi:hypothetical protein